MIVLGTTAVALGRDLVAVEKSTAKFHHYLFLSARKTRLELDGFSWNLSLGIFPSSFGKVKWNKNVRHLIGKPTYFHVIVFVMETDCVLCEVRAAARDRFEDLKYDFKLAEGRDKWRALVSKVMNLRAA